MNNIFPEQVSLLDDQLSDKSRSACSHVEELMLLRTQLAQEKASLAIVQQELRGPGHQGSGRDQGRAPAAGEGAGGEGKGASGGEGETGASACGNTNPAHQ